MRGLLYTGVRAFVIMWGDAACGDWAASLFFRGCRSPIGSRLLSGGRVRACVCFRSCDLCVCAFVVARVLACGALFSSALSRAL